jgi:hypothetical protein
MTIYRFAWGVSAAAATGWAAAVLLADARAPGVIAIALMVGSCAGLLAFTICEDRPDRWHWTTQATLWTAGVTFTWGGLVSVGGGAGSILALTLVATCPFLVANVRALVLRWRLRGSSGPLESLGKRELLRRWEWTTCEVLRGTTTLQRRLALVEQRRLLLDELERRDPTHFDEWVATAVPDRGPPRQRHRRP